MSLGENKRKIIAYACVALIALLIFIFWIALLPRILERTKIGMPDSVEFRNLSEKFKGAITDFKNSLNGFEEKINDAKNEFSTSTENINAEN